MHYDLFLNPRAGAVPASEATSTVPLAYHRTVPGYAPTPLLDLPPAAERLGVRRVVVKDESHRLGLPSFKALGASWATAYAVRRAWLGGTDEVLSPAQLAARIDDPAHKRLVAATDGNHGRGVARMAHLLGVGCLIFVPAGTAASRVAAIESEGAEVRVVDGSYDDAIRRSAQEMDAASLVISDTSWDGYRDIPQQVTAGYATLFTEVDQALRAAGAAAPTTIALQAGVGSFAAAGLLHYRRGLAGAPTTVVVEPRSADCLLRSACEGRITEAPPPHGSAMAGLNCGLPSQQAWPIIEAATDAFVAIDDDAAYEAMRLLADCGVVAGESGAAGLAGLIAVCADDSGAALGLGPDSTVLVVNTEGATDPVNYRAQVGRDPEAVAAASATIRRDAGVIDL